MAIIKVRSSTIDTAGEAERHTMMSCSYDGRIPQEAKDIAKYGSRPAAALVNADVQVRVQRGRVFNEIKAIRRWEKSTGYAPEALAKQLDSNRSSLRTELRNLRSLQTYAAACEAAYQAHEAGVKASQS